jgi:hypothetical protein
MFHSQILSKFCREARQISLSIARLSILLLLVFGFSLITFAQSSDDVIRVDTELTAFEVTVTDKKGNPVRGLKAEDFRVYENDSAREIDFFEPIKTILARFRLFSRSTFRAV